ncbi:hypothetical protein SDJN02_06166, partial [Cucurbita argyrosperma subsp. argyrosperma]
FGLLSNCFEILGPHQALFLGKLFFLFRIGNLRIKLGCTFEEFSFCFDPQRWKRFGGEFDCFHVSSKAVMI